MALCCQPGLQGQQPVPQVCSEGFSSGAQHHPWQWFPYASRGASQWFLLGLSNTKFLESEYLLRELKMFWKSLEAGSLGHIHSCLSIF